MKTVHFILGATLNTREKGGLPVLRRVVKARWLTSYMIHSCSRGSGSCGREDKRKDLPTICPPREDVSVWVGAVLELSVSLADLSLTLALSSLVS